MSTRHLLKTVALIVAAAIVAACSTERAFTITGGAAADCSENTGFDALFAPKCRFENFRNFDRFGPTTVIEAATRAEPLPTDINEIQFSHSYLGEELTLGRFLEQTASSGFIVVKDGTVIDERYYHGNRPSAPNAGFSMTKSIVSALVGAALADGDIKSIDDAVTDYVPALTSPTFSGVTIKQVLQMSSGVKFNEDYSDPGSDINKMSYLVQQMSYVDYINTLDRQHPPGSHHVYASINTHILGLVVANATGKTLSTYLAEKIWEPLGMQYSARWMVDKDGYELPMGGLAITLRDWARFGQLYANRGEWQGRQILPAPWVDESTQPTEAHLLPGKRQNSQHDFGYQYQWWTPVAAARDFMALGIWGQVMYINPEHNTVIVKLSADPQSFSADSEHEIVAYLQALSAALDKEK
ncbi:class C beta-lactamase-related serine hydrolase [Seongchinamella sediminis]|uniref:Class C beta-lactamase-related serine hydrolase n=1 Tax=Seongchinamella sediminis TaxID=2283635 RepID=A0A3L7E134_9GAMM|nr:serine hydrolase [Seongchinamella sediminis]RLQ21961.1 class C beta-lactamase-related serine hydrolase [Seongchinamella sediminis]